jgi:hypothetical protein
MRIPLALALVQTLLLAAGAAPAAAISSPSGANQFLRFEWEVGQDRKGRPEIEGYLYNDYMRSAINVRMIVETLDASGQVIDTTFAYIPGLVPLSSRTYFVVPIKHPGASYRLPRDHVRMARRGVRHHSKRPTAAVYGCGAGGRRRPRPY